MGEEGGRRVCACMCVRACVRACGREREKEKREEEEKKVSLQYNISLSSRHPAPCNRESRP